MSTDAHHSAPSTHSSRGTHSAAKLAARKALQACQPSQLFGTDPHLYPSCLTFPSNNPTLHVLHLTTPKAHRLHFFHPTCIHTSIYHFPFYRRAGCGISSAGASFIFHFADGQWRSFCSNTASTTKFSTRPVLTAFASAAHLESIHNATHSIDEPNICEAVVDATGRIRSHWLWTQDRHCRGLLPPACSNSRRTTTRTWRPHTTAPCRSHLMAVPISHPSMRSTHPQTTCLLRPIRATCPSSNTAPIPCVPTARTRRLQPLPTIGTLHIWHHSRPWATCRRTLCFHNRRARLHNHSPTLPKLGCVLAVTHSH